MIRVLVAEDMHMIRGALVALLSRESDIQVIAELDRGDHVVDEIVRLRPDVAVLDIDMPGVDGITAAKIVHEHSPQCQVLILTGLSQPGYLLRALQAHVRGFLVKDAPAAALADGIRRVVAGERIIDPDLIAAALESGASPLTVRETDVLRSAETGTTTNEIADALFPFPTTVRNYLSNAIAKLGAAIALTRYGSPAMRAGSSAHQRKHLVQLVAAATMVETTASGCDTGDAWG